MTLNILILLLSLASLATCGRMYSFTQSTTPLCCSPGWAAIAITLVPPATNKNTISGISTSSSIQPKLHHPRSKGQSQGQAGLRKIQLPGHPQKLVSAG